MKKIITITVEMFLNIILASIISVHPLTIIINLPIILIISSKIVDNINENKIKDSLFSVSKKGKITQNSLSHPKKIIQAIKSKNKEQYFIIETLKMFIQLEPQKKYTTKSHSKTYILLKQLQDSGYIKNLIKTKTKKSNLIIEKIFLGNFNGLNKKHQMYNITFETTELKINVYNPSIKKLINDTGINVKTDQYGNIIEVNDRKSITEQVVEKPINQIPNKKSDQIQNQKTLSREEQIAALEQLKKDVQSNPEHHTSKTI